MPVDPAVDLDPRPTIIAAHVPEATEGLVTACSCGFQVTDPDSENTEWVQHLAQQLVDRRETDRYRIVRRYDDGRPDLVLKTGVTLAEAQTHSRDHETHGDDWDDGYELEEPDTTVEPSGS